MACGDSEGSCESPRFSFSVNLSSTDITLPETRKRDQDLREVNCSTEFEFSIASSMNANVGFEETLVCADDLFEDGKILPQIPPLRPQSKMIDLISSHFRPNEENSASRSGRKLSSSWKRFFILKKHEYFRAISKDSDENANESSCPEVKPQRFRKFASLFSRKRGRRPPWNGLFCVFPFSRKKSVAQSTSFEVPNACKETQALVSSSKPAEAICSNNGDLMEVKSFRQSDPIITSPAGNNGRSSPGRIMSRNLECRSRRVIRTKDRVVPRGFDSPPPGKVMGERLLKKRCVKSKASVKTGRVLNVVEPPLFTNAFFPRKQNRAPVDTRFYYYRRNSYEYAQTRCSLPTVSDHNEA